MNNSPTNLIKALALIVAGVAIGAMFIYVAAVDDAPGGAAIGIGLMIAALVLASRALRNRLPAWALRAAIVLGAAIAVFGGTLAYGVTAAAPLHPDPQDVPAASQAPPSPQWAAAIEQARPLVRAAVADRNLPGVSVAVGAGGEIVWAEGFGWRDVGTRTPVTPATRFVIGAAPAALVAAAAVPGMTSTGSEPATAWSPEQVGEEGEDFPPLTLLRHRVFQPLGLAAPEYPLADERATFYVPRSNDDPRRGRRLIYMRDLACCGDGMAFFSTASDLVRFGLARPAQAIRQDGELAGGQVMTLLTVPDRGLVVAVLANVTHADTATLAARIADAFVAGR